MRFRKLRTACSVVWGLACILMIVLWVRSYWWADIAHLSLRHRTIINSVAGNIQVSDISGPTWKSELLSTHADDLAPKLRGVPRWHHDSATGNISLRFPHGLLGLKRKN